MGGGEGKEAWRGIILWENFKTVQDSYQVIIASVLVMQIRLIL